MKRTFEVTVKISGKGIDNWDTKDGITTFKECGNSRSTQNSIINGIKRDLGKTGCKLEDVIKFTETTVETETKDAKKPTKKTTKKQATITVILKAFTGMNIGTYTAQITKDGYKITTKNGKEMEFKADGTQKVDCKNPKFNNRIEVVAEA